MIKTSTLWVGSLALQSLFATCIASAKPNLGACVEPLHLNTNSCILREIDLKTCWDIPVLDIKMVRRQRTESGYDRFYLHYPYKQKTEHMLVVWEAYPSSQIKTISYVKEVPGIESFESTESKDTVESFFELVKEFADKKEFFKCSAN